MDTTSPTCCFAENISFAAMWAKWIGIGPHGDRPGCRDSRRRPGRRRRSLGRRRPSQSAWIPRSRAMLLLLVPLISPQGWDYVLLVATPAIVCLLDRFRGRPRRWQVVNSRRFLLTELHDLRPARPDDLSVAHVAVGDHDRRRSFWRRSLVRSATHCRGVTNQTPGSLHSAAETRCPRIADRAQLAPAAPLAR